MDTLRQILLATTLSNKIGASNRLSTASCPQIWRLRSTGTTLSTNIVFDKENPLANDTFLDHISRTRDQPDRTITPPRDPYMVHPGDDFLVFTATRSPVRCYHSSCQTFVDLVDDAPDWDPGSRRIRIRGGARRRWTPRELEDRSGAATWLVDPPIRSTRLRTFTSTKKFRSGPQLDAHKIMSPPGCTGSMGLGITVPYRDDLFCSPLLKLWEVLLLVRLNHFANSQPLQVAGSSSTACGWWGWLIL